MCNTVWLKHMSVLRSTCGSRMEVISTSVGEYKLYRSRAFGGFRSSFASVSNDILEFSDAKGMAVEVRNTLKEIIKHNGNKSEAEAEAYLENLSKTNRYLADIWA